ncbi:MAG: LytTR family DNA-binding domain-containing protein [Bacteroidales bacterium]
MFENLNQHYPFNNNFKHNVKTIGLVTVGFILIVLYFQPFGINFLKASFYGYFVLILGLLSALILSFHSIILPELFSTFFKEKQWTIKKEIAYNLWIAVELAGIFIAASAISNVIGFPHLSLGRTGALALLPIILLNFINYNIFLRNKVSRALGDGLTWFQEEKEKKSKEKEEKRFFFRVLAENQKDFFEGNIQSLLAVKSASNYVEFYYLDGFELKKKLLRITLTSVARALGKYNQIKKCHRSWLVNLDHVEHLHKQGQAFSLMVGKMDSFVPIARNHVPWFKKFFENRKF